MIAFEELKERARIYAKERELNRFITFGSVAAALLTDKGNVYLGISLDTACSMGFCAEHAAVAEMLKYGEFRVVKVLAVTENGEVVPPCGRCRELLTQLAPENYHAQVMVDSQTVFTLKELLPYDWKPTLQNNK